MRRDLPYVQCKVVKSRPYWYFRHDNIYQRLPGVPGDPEFHARYSALLASVRSAATSKGAAGTVIALITEYKQSPEFRRLADKTQRDYARALDLLQPIGKFQAADILRQDIIKLRNKVSARSGNRAADLFATVVARCFKIGLDLGYVEVNRFTSIERLAAEAESHTAWPMDIRERFLASGPPEHLITAFMIGLWTALRRSDIVRLGRQHNDGVRLTLRPEKTRRRTGVEVSVPIFAALRRHLDGLPENRLLYVARPDGTAINADVLTHEMASHMAAIGLSGFTLHGLRHTTGSALAEAGATPHEIQAILGHTTLAMAERYTRQVDRKRLAESGMRKLASRTPGERQIGKQAATSGKPKSGKRD